MAHYGPGLPSVLDMGQQQQQQQQHQETMGFEPMRNPVLQDYQLQLMLLETHNQNRVLMARQEASPEDTANVTIQQDKSFTYAPVNETAFGSSSPPSQYTAQSLATAPARQHNAVAYSTQAGKQREKPISQGDADGGKAHSTKRGAARNLTSVTHEETDEDEGDSDHDGRRKKQKPAPSDKSATIGNLNKKFACPYFKRNRRKYCKWTSCPGPGWDEVHRVKTHLYRRHALPLQCPRCWGVFKSDNLLRAHLQQDPRVGFTKDQEKRLRSRKKAQADMTDEDKWREIYMIVFPDDDRDSLPSPYYDATDYETSSPNLSSDHGRGSDLEDYATFIRREMPTFVRRELEALFQEDEFKDVDERIRPRVAQIMLDLQPRLLNLYKQSQSPLSEYGPQPVPPSKTQDVESESPRTSASEPRVPGGLTPLTSGSDTGGSGSGSQYPPSNMSTKVGLGTDDSQSTPGDNSPWGVLGSFQALPDWALLPGEYLGVDNMGAGIGAWDDAAAAPSGVNGGTGETPLGPHFWDFEVDRLLDPIVPVSRGQTDR
ncbi:hypothetical protein B0T17DRAFT_618444 [Bombardia bombarda]|uniref:C2H2-type domain-containing protein n=1 Tax=Bombardia bombarda TaxID=252184 RepID=A0AA39WLX6_9PEZI|nr:hypothetical protein B0T17DRAFT_618444 [Bombardia bombarda]